MTTRELETKIKAVISDFEQSNNCIITSLSTGTIVTYSCVDNKRVYSSRPLNITLENNLE